MSWLRWVVVTLGTVQGGFMLFDGLRALVTGDYTTPRSGEHAGELGPWADLVSAMGIDPRSTGVKVAFAIYGATWLGAAIGTAAGRSWGWVALVVAGVGTLWYLPIGTVVSVAVVGLVLLAWVRGGL